MKIAFFGLGAMGEPMAAHLLRAGYSVSTAVHRSRAAAERLLPLGLELCDCPADAVRSAEVIITILPTDKEVLSFLTDEAFAGAVTSGAVILEMSSTTTEAVQEVERFYADRGVQVVDAPVSGGVAGAQKGKLTVFGAGAPEAQAKVRPVLDVFSGTVYSLGPCGMGKTIKNLDNLLSMYNLMGLCEAYHIAMKNGVDPQLFYDVIGSNSGASRALTNRWFKLVNGEFEPGFTLRLARKDIKNALALGEGVPLPMSGLLYELMTAAAKYDDEDVNALRKLFE